jgi:hypothetical protein
MPRKLFQKGNSGRVKGSKNRFTNLRDSFLNVYQGLGGDEAFLKWVQKAKYNNKKEFYQMVSKMLPREIEMSGPGGAPLNTAPPTINIISVTSNGNGKAIPDSNPADTNAGQSSRDIIPASQG